MFKFLVLSVLVAILAPIRADPDMDNIADVDNTVAMPMTGMNTDNNANVDNNADIDNAANIDNNAEIDFVNSAGVVTKNKNNKAICIKQDKNDVKWRHYVEKCYHVPWSVGLQNVNYVCKYRNSPTAYIVFTTAQCSKTAYYKNICPTDGGYSVNKIKSDGINWCQRIQ